MKRIITVLLSLIMVFSLFACDDVTDGDAMTFKASYFDGVLTLKLDGGTVKAVNLTEFSEDRVNVRISLAIIGGSGTLSGDMLSADFSGNVTYEMSIDLAGDAEQVANYIEESKNHLLSSVETDADKKLIDDLFDGKTVSFDRSSALSELTEGFVSVKAKINRSTGIALITESVYESGEKWVFEYNDNGEPKSRTFYDSNGNPAYSESFDEDPAETNDTTDPDQSPDDTKSEEDETYEISFDDSYFPMPETTDDMYGTLPPDAELVIPSVSDGDTKLEIDLSDGVLFYMQGTFTGKYSGMDSVIDFPSDKKPIFTLTVLMNENNATIKQTVTVRNGKLIYHNGILAIIDFAVDEISYSMKMEITGSGASVYKQQMLNDLNGSGMSDTDKKLYRDALDGKEISFGKESEIYKGMKLPMIKFKLDTSTLIFESERFDPDENKGSDKIESDSPTLEDLLNPNLGANTNNNQGNSGANQDEASTETKKER